MKLRSIAGFAITAFINCSTLPVPEQNNWDIRSFGSEKNEYATCIALQGRNTIWLAGFKIVATEYSNPALSRISDLSSDIFIQSDQTLNARIYSIRALNQNGIIAAGYKLRAAETGLDRDPLLACYDNMCKPLWVYTNDSLTDDCYWHSSINDKGEIIAVGQKKTNDNFGYFPLIAKHEIGGNLISSRTFQIMTQSGAIAATSTGSGYLIAITELVPAGESSAEYKEAISLAKINDQMDSIAVFRLSDGTAKCMVKINDTYIVGGHIHQEGVVNLVCADSDGNKKWIVKYGEQQTDFQYELADIVSGYGDSAFVILGNAWSRKASMNNMIFLAKFSTEGTFCWERMYTAFDAVKGLGITSLHEGEGYAICGAIKIPGQGNYDMYLLKTDIAGAIGRPTEPFSYSLY